jgi:prepilin-type processing-associated H-X9-DG protein
LYSTYSFNGVTPNADGIPANGTPTFFFRDESGRRQPSQLTRIKFPGDLIMFHDGSEVMMDGNGDALCQLDQDDWDDEKPEWINEYLRHPKGCVVTWADGHVSTISEAAAKAERRYLTRTYGRTHGIPLRWYSAH